MADRHVLLADRDPARRQLVDLLLAADGYEVVAVEDGREALEHLVDRTPTLAVLELDLPVVSGADLCHAMRRVARLANVPIVLTAPGDDREAEGRGRRVGADLVLREPLGDKNLRERARRLVELAARREVPPEAGPDDLLAEALEALARGEAPGWRPGEAPRVPLERDPGSAEAAPDAAREAAHGEDALRALRQENLRLKREVRRLRKELERDESELRERLEEQAEKLVELKRRYRLLKESVDEGGPLRGLFRRRR